MKAIVYFQYGPPEVLQLAELPKPVPKENEILIRVHAAEATKADCEMRAFRFVVNWIWLPMRLALGIRRPRKPVLGGYFSGVVESTGAQVTRFKPGDALFGSVGMRIGAYCDYICLPEEATLAPKPDNLSFEQAAAVPLGGLNALHFLRKANIQAGEHVLINGAGGSIGTFAVQIAKAMGAEVSAVDSPVKADMLRTLGVKEFIDYTKEDFTRRGKQYDVIFNMVASYPYGKAIGALRPGGRYLLGNPPLMSMIRSLFTPLFSDKNAYVAFAGEKEEELLTLKRMIEAGEITPVIDGVFLPEEAAEAHRRVEQEARLGGVVIQMKTPDAHPPKQTHNS